MADENKKPIVVKRIKKGAHGHHGGAWKIAYADFMTAMMAFFLLMWLTSSASDEQLAGISEYFAPSSTSMSRSGAGGMLGGITVGEGSKTSDRSSAVSPNISLPPSMAPMGTGGGDAYDKMTEEEKAKQLLAEKEEETFEKAKHAIEVALEENPDLKGLSKNLIIDNTPEGLRIQLIDQENIPMFPSGSNIMSNSAKKLLEAVAKVIIKMPNRISISGHTDAVPYLDPNGYGNWELSADRALATMRELIDLKVDPNKLYKIVGFEDNDPFVKDDPNHPNNRRISIVLLRDHPLIDIKSHPAAAGESRRRPRRSHPVNPFTGR